MKFNIRKTMSYTAALSLSVAVSLVLSHQSAKAKRLEVQAHNQLLKQQHITAVMQTNLGDIELVLYDQQAPQTVKNFIHYAETGHYNDTLFHKVIHNFLIQGGGYKQDMSKIHHFAPVKNEASVNRVNARGTVAMARKQKNNCAQSEFFFNLADNKSLDIPNGYTVFARVISGMDLLDEIDEQSKHNKHNSQKTKHPVIVKQVRIHYPEQV